MLFGSVRLFALTMSSTVTSNSRAMPESVSPGLTVYLTGCPGVTPGGRGAPVAVGGCAVGEGAGVTSKCTCSIGVLVGSPGPGVGAGAPTVRLQALRSA